MSSNCFGRSISLVNQTNRLNHVLRAGGLATMVAMAVVALPARPVYRAMAASPQTLRIWYGSDDPTEQAWVKQIVQRFASAHPALSVRFSFYSLDDMNDKTQLALSSGNTPDLIYNT